MNKIKRALISVTDKTDLEIFAKGLVELDVEIVSTGGTARYLEEHGITVRQISDLTDFPEILDGRVKTLNPKVAGGILAMRNNPEHQQQCTDHNIEPIDLIVVNLYAFEKTVANPDATFEEAIENIDIGGPSLIRAAAKNHNDVAVVTDPNDYRTLLDELQNNAGLFTEPTRRELARKAFALTAHYDAAISRYLNKTVGTNESTTEESLQLNFRKGQTLRYGENPHQQATLYLNNTLNSADLTGAKQLHGKELSYNNFLDLDASYNIVREFDETACVIIKHSNPAGVAISGDSLEAAFEKALACDPTSAFGGIIGLNRPVDAATATQISKAFYEAVLAPAFDDDALEILQKKKNLRLLELPGLNDNKAAPSQAIRQISGGLLVQDADVQQLDIRTCKVPSKLQPTEEQWQALAFNWRVAKHVKSNAIIIGLKDRTIGVGAGQMSRVDSTMLAVKKSQHPIEGAVLASDAFFPFRDNIDEAAKVGISAIISPGGSIRDDEVIAAADEHGIAMVFTGMRHFRH